MKRVSALGAPVAAAALLALAFAPVADAQASANSTFPLVLDSGFSMRNDANNSFCQSYYVRVPARTYFDFRWCQGNGNGLGIVYTDADTIAATDTPPVPRFCRKVDDLRAFALDYQMLANDMPRETPGWNTNNTFCAQAKRFPTICYNTDVTIYLSFSNYWSGQFDNGTLWPSSWYGTSRPRDLNVTMTKIEPSADLPACRDVGSFTTKTRVPGASTTSRRLPTPKIEGAEFTGTLTNPTATAGAPKSGATTGVQVAFTTMVALAALVAGVLAAM
ncbi:hypothetical protein DFJ74DRAFT_758387 [Hyaloraphidium curvatum]|nr:hypothetical protein DFJ74DRAFT_758387 [Hyaloraphidium curvatum]